MIWFEKKKTTHAQRATDAAEIRIRRRSSPRWSMTGMRPSGVRGGLAFLRRNLVTTGLGQVVGCEPGARNRDGGRAPPRGAGGGASAAEIAVEPFAPLDAAPFTAGVDDSSSW